jgi:Uma2 family endonuclease
MSTQPYNAAMGTRTAEYLEAINHLPDRAVLTFDAVDWDEYERLLDELVERPGLRVSYDDGMLEIVSTSAEHERYKDFILLVVHAVGAERGLTIESLGSTTWRRRVLRKGAEADTCFYVASAASIIGKQTVHLDTDPPPDIVVEIDIARKSLDKFSIYAAFGVPEFWRYDGRIARFYQLGDAGYREVEESRSFPGLSSQLVTESLEQSKSEGQTAALSALRRRLRVMDR